MLALGVVIGLLSSAVPYALELRALRHLPAATFGVLMSLEPAAAALAGWSLLGQPLRLVQVVGLAVVVVASALAAVPGRRAAGEVVVSAGRRRAPGSSPAAPCAPAGSPP